MVLNHHTGVDISCQPEVGFQITHSITRVGDAVSPCFALHFSLVGNYSHILAEVTMFFGRNKFLHDGSFKDDITITNLLQFFERHMLCINH
jgi:hypothetical protein